MLSIFFLLIFQTNYWQKESPKIDSFSTMNLVSSFEHLADSFRSFDAESVNFTIIPASLMRELNFNTFERFWEMIEEGNRNWYGNYQLFQIYFIVTRKI